VKERIRKLRAELGRRGLDAYMVTQNTRYLSGTTAGKVVIVPPEGEPVLLCSRLEFWRAKAGKIRDVRAFSMWDSPLRDGEQVYVGELWHLIADCLKELKVRYVGYDRLSPQILRKLRGLHIAGYRELPQLMLEIRAVKSKDEISYIKKSAAVVSKAMKTAAEIVEAERTELEIAAEVEHEMRRAGSDGTPFQTIVASGRNSWFPHAAATTKKLRKGELVVIDMGATINGYCSDMTRTFSISPSGKQQTIVDVVRKAQRVALTKVKAGVKASVVDGAARATIKQAGYAKFFPHGMGHGVGLDIHELPSLAPTSRDVLHEGMVTTVEPGIYIPNIGGARWEDMCLVKRRGYSLLT
jgi:Xaa-Pro aminopeptidase